MKLWGNRGNDSPIGMDIGRRGVRMVQRLRHPHQASNRLAGARSTLGGLRAFCWDWPSADAPGAPGSEDDGPVAAALRSPDGCRELGARTKRFLWQNEFRGKDLIVGLSSPEVEVHALELPIHGDGEPDENLRQAARWEIERLTSLPQGKVETDFWLLPGSCGTGSQTAEQAGTPAPHHQQHPGQPTAIGVAADKRTVSGVWKTCEAAGVVCRRLDAGLCALSRFGSWLRGLPQAEGEPDGERDAGTAPEIWGLLDLGYSQVRLIICTEDVPVLVRFFDTGGHRWIGRISDSLGLSFAAAEVHLRDHGISAKRAASRSRSDDGGRGVRRDDPPKGDAGSTAPSAHLGGIIRNILREELDALCTEIERSYRYALQCYPQHRASELILVGGGAGMRNLDEYLGGHLGIEVHPAAKRLDGTVMAAHTGAGTPVMRGGVGGHYSIGALACAIGLTIPP